MTLTYLCPATDQAAGGVKVIYRHVEMLAAMGIAADVLHPLAPTFTCGWFAHHAPMRRTLAFDAARDVLVIPEIWAAAMAARCAASGTRYAILVQGGHLIAAGGAGHSPIALQQAYAQASVVICVSDATREALTGRLFDLAPERIHRITPGVGPQFTAAAKGKTITYMPRKLPEHAAAVCTALHGRLPSGWRLTAIDGLHEDEVARALAASPIFMSFSDREGLGLPPLEAALAGNIVVGYHGDGGAEYFQRPIFRAVAPGDLGGYVEEVLRAVDEIEREPEGADWGDPGAALRRPALRQQMQALRLAYGSDTTASQLLMLARLLLPA